MNSVDKKLNELWLEYEDRASNLLFDDIADKSDCRFIKAFCELILDRVEYQERLCKFVSEVGNE